MSVATMNETGTETDPKVEVRRARRSWPVEYKTSILDELDRARASGVRGELGRVCRREGLYKSVVEGWSRQRDAGTLVGSSERKRGPKTRDPAQAQVAGLTAKIAVLESKLADANELVAAQGKAFALLGSWCPKSAKPSVTN